ncbi:MAG: LAGLIDADG homing endonuclease [Candidatus Amesbacteria bacterium GW2011_GWB1_47_19]|nr:MAG: LAGLIDADG homing endonuclease [Candidatus Amesbacteria bacterium GW2011_GWC1_46_24]KKU66839.1 MAG: LAGLIDADG homing endonuclease [Candidatus Amesbacteria bacterium GW2011_GWB1_47_19]OGD05604.1 MAG: hypothetical protein A2379_00215 [Candidatus Amesbacteria bacterium RIFOXYB1_FULL_47_13]HBC72246.1 hypothetical protein [Candidatus Amesbacteria bacterium]
MGIPREPFGFAQGKPLGRRRDYTRAPVTKAYLMGIIHDATERKLTFRIAQKSEEFLRYLSRELALSDIKSWIYKEGKTRQVWILEFSKKHLTGIKIKSRKDKVDYLRGYFDAEGGIARNPNVRFYLYYCQKNFDEMVQVKTMLEDIGISCGKIHNPNRIKDPDFYRFYIRAKSYTDFARKIGSLHPEKMSLLRMKI